MYVMYSIYTLGEKKLIVQKNTGALSKKSCLFYIATYFNTVGIFFFFFFFDVARFVLFCEISRWENLEDTTMVWFCPDALSYLPISLCVIEHQ